MCMEHYVTVIRDNACFQALAEEEAATGEGVPSRAGCLMMCMITAKRLITETTVTH